MAYFADICKSVRRPLSPVFTAFLADFRLFSFLNFCNFNKDVHFYKFCNYNSTRLCKYTILLNTVQLAPLTSTSMYTTAASTGCLQYFTGVSGKFFSFNYNDATGLQLSDTDYSVCIRMERNFCGIQYSACADTGRGFTKLH